MDKLKRIEKKKARRRRYQLSAYTLVGQLNASDLGCRLHRNHMQKTYYDEVDRRYQVATEGKDDMTADIQGTARDGRSIYIMFRKTHSIMTKRRALFLQEMEAMNCLVGCAHDFDDCRDIIKEQKRKERTYAFRKNRREAVDKLRKKQRERRKARARNENPKP